MNGYRERHRGEQKDTEEHRKPQSDKQTYRQVQIQTERRKSGGRQTQNEGETDRQTQTDKHGQWHRHKHGQKQRQGHERREREREKKSKRKRLRERERQRLRSFTSIRIITLAGIELQHYNDFAACSKQKVMICPRPAPPSGHQAFVIAFEAAPAKQRDNIRRNSKPPHPTAPNLHPRPRHAPLYTARSETSVV